MRFALTGDTVPSFLDVPFPSDVYLKGGKIIDPLPGLDAVIPQNASFLSHELGKLNGFSRVALALFRVDDRSAAGEGGATVPPAALDASSLPTTEAACAADGSSVFFIDLDAKAGAPARLPCRAQIHDDTARKSKTPPVLAVGPARGVVLAEGHKYAAVVTSRVKDKAGKGLAASADFEAIRKGNAGGAAGVYADAYTKVTAALAGVLGDAQIVGLAPFTTNAMTNELFTLRDALEGAPAPTLAWDADAMKPMGATKFAAVAKGGALPAGYTASLDAWLGVVDAAAKLPDGTDDPDGMLPVRAHDKIAAFGTAVFDATNYLIVKPKGYDELDHATFAHDDKGNVVPAPGNEKVKIWASFAIPSTPMPASGYPVVIVQHGLNGSRAYLLQLANLIASKGWIAVGIDSVTFGARAPEAKFQVDASTDYVKAPGATYDGPDGISDALAGVGRNGSSDLFGSLKNIGAIRDQIRQASFDIAQLVKVLRGNPDLSPLKTGADAPKIDATKIAYVGDSLGAMEGSIAAAIEPSVKAWTLNVVGGGLFTELGAHSPTIAQSLQLAGGFNFGLSGDTFNESSPFVTLTQTVVDPGDPLAYAADLVTHPAPLAGAATAPRNVLQFEVLYDEIVPNEANEAFARAAGLGIAKPNVGSNAGIRDVKHPGDNPNAIPFTSVDAAADGTFHDVPSTGVTAIVVQVSPGAHGSNIVQSVGFHGYAIPFGRFDETTPFVQLDKDKQFGVKEDLRGVQTAMTGFFASALDGKVPVVSGFSAPVRDYDGDGALDDVDADPNDPKVK